LGAAYVVAAALIAATAGILQWPEPHGGVRDMRGHLHVSPRNRRDRNLRPPRHRSSSHSRTAAPLNRDRIAAVVIDSRGGGDGRNPGRAMRPCCGLTAIQPVRRKVSPAGIAPTTGASTARRRRDASRVCTPDPNDDTGERVPTTSPPSMTRSSGPNSPAHLLVPTDTCRIRLGSGHSGAQVSAAGPRAASHRWPQIA